MVRQTLLPPNHTQLEEAFDLTGARIDEFAVDVPKLVRPWETPATHLAWLAWGLSVDLWEPDWPEESRRALAAKALPMHARKGTQVSIAEHIRIMGADPRRFIVPPAKTFLMETLTEEERQAFLARFPQLRIYPFVTRGTYRFAHFTSSAFGRAKAYLDASCIKDVGAWSRYVRTARLWDRGAETALTIRAISQEGLGRHHAAAFDEVVLGEKLFGPRPYAEVLIGELDGVPQGFALFFHNFSTFEGKPGIYLEDLFVRPEARGSGLGKALLAELAALALARDCARLEWSVLDWNAPAIGFYKKLGARLMDEWTVMRVDGADLARLGSGLGSEAGRIA
jgi:GNAT superfamily N-acetyltransferase